MKIEILCSAATGKIYAARVDAKGHIKDKVDVTKQTIDAVMKHMDVRREEYDHRAGDLIFKPKTTCTTYPAN